LLARIRLDLVSACPAPDHDPRACRGGAAERGRRAGFGFHPASLEDERDRANGFAGYEAD